MNNFQVTALINKVMRERGIDRLSATLVVQKMLGN